jgi:fructokinase
MRADLRPLRDREIEQRRARTIARLEEPGRSSAETPRSGVELVLVSLGADEAFYATREFSGGVLPFGVEAVDATGAGDAFGAAAGATACTDFGAMRALPMKEELERFMAGG